MKLEKEIIIDYKQLQHCEDVKELREYVDSLGFRMWDIDYSIFRASYFFSELLIIDTNLIARYFKYIENLKNAKIEYIEKYITIEEFKNMIGYKSTIDKTTNVQYNKRVEGKVMTVKKLIKKLSKLPQGASVIFDDKDELQVSSVSYEKEYCDECKIDHELVRLGALKKI